MRPNVVSSSPFDPVETAAPADPITDFWWDNDPTSGDCALRGRNGEVLRVVVQTGSTWCIYQDGMLLDARGTRKEARERALEMWRTAGR